MIKNILDGITSAIYTEFGDEYEINIDSVKQGLKEPCFFVLCINPTDSIYRGDRRFISNLFGIHYFPKHGKLESYEVIERLNSALEYITVDGNLTRGTNITFEFSDEVLICTVNYDFFGYVSDDGDKMEKLKVEGGTNGN